MIHEVRVRGERIGAVELPDEATPLEIDEARQHYARTLTAERREASEEPPPPGADPAPVPQPVKQAETVCGICGQPQILAALMVHMQECATAHGVDLD